MPGQTSGNLACTAGIRLNSMGVLKRNYIVILLGALLLGVFLFYNSYIISLGNSYLREEVYVKNLVLDMMCDIAESADSREALLTTVGEIDTLKQRGVYCAAYDTELNVISERSPLFGPYDPLEDRDLRRDVDHQNRGKADIMRKAGPDVPAHVVHTYWRWVYQASDEPILIILGMSKFAVETNHESGLVIGLWVLCGAFGVLAISVVVPFILMPKRRAEND